MQIHSHVEHGKLNDGDLVQTATGELRRVSKHQYGTGPVETWLEHWSDEYAAKLTDEKFVDLAGQTAEQMFPLTVMTAVPAPVHVISDEQEAAIRDLVERGQWVVDRDPRYRLDLSPAAVGDAGRPFSEAVTDYAFERYMDAMRPYAEAEPARYEPLSRFEPAARRDGERFAAALLDRRPDLARAGERTARMLVDLFHLVAARVGDPNDWDHVGTVLDLLDWARRSDARDEGRTL